MEFTRMLFPIPSTDPDDARRRKLLNLLLVGVGVLSLLTLLASIVLGALGFVAPQETAWLTRITVIMLITVAIIFAVNRFRQGWLASALFLIAITIVFAYADEPRQIVEGRSLFLFAIPILIASVLIQSWVAFIVAAVNTLLISWLALQLDIIPPVPSLLGLFVVALISWLATRNLEQALQDLRRGNRELDQRVADRTLDLAEALAREHGVAGRNQAILESIADGVIVFDRQSQAIIANPAITRLIEQPADEIVGYDVEALMSDSVVGVDRDIVLDLVQDRETRHPSIKLEWGQKTLSVSFAPVRGQNGEVTGTVGVFRDFTREAELDRMKNDFISIASHELRTPLTSIRGYLDLVLMGAAGPIDAQQRSFLQIVKENTDRLHELVNDLLDISRIESGRVELDVNVVSLPGLIKEVTTLFRNQFQAKGLNLIVDVPEDLPQILADSARLSQVFRNLVSNAYKYTSDGSVIIQAHAADGSVRIDIQDSGIGISKADLDKLFTRFFRAEDPLVREQAGTGLGLNITKSLVEMHGGKIWAESTVGAGTTFSVALPVPGVSPGVTSKQPAGRVPVTTNSAGAHILVVDNEPDIAQLLKTQLEFAGYKVDTAAKGTEVLAEARRLKPDLITLDLLMDIDGLAVLKQLKEDPSLADTPVIVISVLPSKERGLTLGAADYLIKPLDGDELRSAIERVLGPCDKANHTQLLVVDDDPDIRHWLELALGHEGFDVKVARDGVEALSEIDANMPDLVLLDIMMPVMDGREMLRVLREQERTRDLPVIVLTAVPFGSEEERDQILNMGVTKLLRKPVTAEQLADEIGAALN